MGLFREFIEERESWTKLDEELLAAAGLGVLGGLLANRLFRSRIDRALRSRGYGTGRTGIKNFVKDMFGLRTFDQVKLTPDQINQLTNRLKDLVNADEKYSTEKRSPSLEAVKDVLFAPGSVDERLMKSLKSVLASYADEDVPNARDLRIVTDSLTANPSEEFSSWFSRMRKQVPDREEGRRLDLRSFIVRNGGKANADLSKVEIPGRRPMLTATFLSKLGEDGLKWAEWLANSQRKRKKRGVEAPDYGTVGFSAPKSVSPGDLETFLRQYVLKSGAGKFKGAPMLEPEIPFTPHPLAEPAQSGGLTRTAKALGI